MRLPRAPLLALALFACRSRATPNESPAPDAAHAREPSRSPSPAPATPPANVPPATPPTGAGAAWCWQALPHVDLRAIDRHESLWSVRGRALENETHHDVMELPEEVPCPTRGAWQMEFGEQGSAFALVDSRFYVRSSERVGFAVTPMCSDVSGAPWSSHEGGGFGFVVHTWEPAGPGLMLTRDGTGSMGWYAITALDRTMTAAVMDRHHSLLTLSSGGHLILVDQVNTVAGEVLATQSETFAGLTRSAAGIVAFRDASATTRTLVFTEAVDGPFERVTGTRPPGGATRAVYRVDPVRFVAVTEGGIELSLDRGEHFETVLPVSALPSPSALARTSAGWLAGHVLAVATTEGVASERCVPLTPADSSRDH